MWLFESVVNVTGKAVPWTELKLFLGEYFDRLEH